jgi:hypothetical protein
MGVFSGAVTGFLGFIIAVHGVSCLVTLGLLTMRAEVEPIRSRAPLLLSTFVPLNFVLLLGICLSNMLSNVSCEVQAVLEYSLNAFFVAYVFMRCGYIYVKFQIAHESLLVALDDNGEVAISKLKFSKYRKWIRGSYTTMLAWVLILMLTFPVFIFISASNSEDLQEPCFRQNAAYQVLVYVYRAFYIFAAGFFAYKFRKEPLDHFWLYEELKYSLIVGGALLILFVLFTQTPLGVYRTSFPISSFTPILFLLMFNVFNTIYPGFLSRANQKRTFGNPSSAGRDVSVPGVSMQVKTLDDIIAVPGGEEAWIRFLEMEFSLENWMFKREVLMYKAIQDIEALRNKAIQIVQDYIADHAVHEVNLSWETRQAFYNAFQSWDTLDLTEKREIFDEAVKEIIQILMQDSFRRFRHSDQYKQFMEEFRKTSLPNPVTLTDI